MSQRKTAPIIRSMKGSGTPIVSCTAYDALETELLELAEIDVILVGDSVGNTKLGFHHSTQVTHEMMLHHVRACSRASVNSLLLADMAFGSYQISPEEATANAIELIQAGAHAVKLEGPYYDEIAAIVKAGIPVMGHLGMTPQSVLAFGGHKVQGKTSDDANRIIEEAKQLEKAGAFAVVLELIPADLAQKITESISIPTIGIGAGIHCDGQVQVLTDILGLSNKVYKHAKAYLNARELIVNALSTYASETRNKSFPTSENSF